MGLFSTTPRNNKQQNGATAPSKTSRLIRIRSVLSLKDASNPYSSRRSSSGVISKSQSLTVLVQPNDPKNNIGPCRFIATSTKLGSGAYGACLLGRDAATSAPVAIKFIPDGRMRASSLEREITLLSRLSEVNHPSLVKFHGHFKPYEVKAGEVRAEGTLPLQKPHTTCHALVMEAARGGELFDYVVKREGLKEPESAPLFAQLCDAVRTAHSLGVVHRDLKLENVLLVHDKKVVAAAIAAGETGASSKQAIKLIDWGLAHQHALTSDGQILPEKLHSRCGSRSYMAPEVTNREISGTIGYDGFAADTWSLGVCLFAMHLAFFPFEQANPEVDWRARRVVEAQKAGKSTMQTILGFYPQKAPNGGLSDGLIALLDKMLIFDPKKRVSLQEVLESPWVAPHLPQYAHQTRLHAAVPSLVRLATRTSASSISESGTEGPPTPRTVVDGVVPVALEHESSRRSSGHSRSTSLGHQLPFPQVALPDASGNWVAAAPGTNVPPPPPSPLRESTVPPQPHDDDSLLSSRVPAQHVVAGSGRVTPRLSSPKHGRYSSHEKEASQLAALLSKVVKVSSNGSPRKPARPDVDFCLV